MDTKIITSQNRKQKRERMESAPVQFEKREIRIILRSVTLFQHTISSSIYYIHIISGKSSI